MLTLYLALQSLLYLIALLLAGGFAFELGRRARAASLAEEEARRRESATRAVNVYEEQRRRP